MTTAKLQSETTGERFPARNLAQGKGPKPELGLPMAKRLQPWEDRLRGVSQLTLLEQALRMASDAERRLAAQADRIARLEVLTMTDELTGLLNRRGFDAQLGRALATVNRNGSTGILAISDVDNFKAINDHYGHPIGDEVLRELARRILANVRETDYVARIGGDEFAVLMVETGIAYGMRRINALSQLIGRSVVTLNGHRIPVHVSFGIESFGPGDRKKDLISRADAAMFDNKRRKPATSSAPSASLAGNR
ncbi:MAG: GGDEF domain-containing protein [Alphaproteobacteria bacterium]|nr:GGDEF domain-containing protein [Alphaproteobacteria bacterium]